MQTQTAAAGVLDVERAGPARAARPHIVLIVPRGEAVRNFFYSDTLPALAASARVSVLSVVADAEFRGRVEGFAEELVPLEQARQNRAVAYVRALTDAAHDRWLGSAVARNRSDIRDAEARATRRRGRRVALKALARLCANRPALAALTSVERSLSWHTRPDDTFVELFQRIRPDLVFNGSHIHGPAADLPVTVAHRLGIPTAGFIFSWDNLTSRSRIFPPYDYFVLWTAAMRTRLLDIYHDVNPDRVFVTGTPQFDFHFRPRFLLNRRELCARLGLDPERPIVLYTAGIDKHFPEEHRHVEAVAGLLDAMEVQPKPQLVVRLYVKGTSAEMKALAARGLPNTVFPAVQWDERWYTPAFADLEVYTSLLAHCSVGINAASTVSLELLIHDKPVINLGFDPPGSHLPPHLCFERHIHFDHFKPVVESGATAVATSVAHMGQLLQEALANPSARRVEGRRFLRSMFGDMLDGQAAARVADQLLRLATHDEASGQ